LLGLKLVEELAINVAGALFVYKDAPLFGKKVAPNKSDNIRKLL